MLQAVISLGFKDLKDGRMACFECPMICIVSRFVIYAMIGALACNHRIPVSSVEKEL